MTLTSLVDLRDERTWEPARLMAATFEWPSDLPRVAVGDVVSTVLPSGVAPEGTQVVTPGNLDRVAGGIRSRSRKYQGPVYQVGSADNDLHAGDVLVPPSSEAPALLVTEDFVGSTFSARFMALRPTAGHELWLWAVLSSRSGRTARSHLAAGSTMPRVNLASLLELHIPWVSLARLNHLADALRALERNTHGNEAEAVESWWRVTDLREFSWQTAMATPSPEALRDGVHLADYCRVIRRGGPIPRELIVDQPVENALPLADISVLSGKPTKRWALAEPDVRLTVASPGDVLLASLGTHPYATVATGRSAVHPNVFVLTLQDASLGPALARYLNSQAGYGMRQVLSTGSGTQHLSRTNLERMPVPQHELWKAERQPSNLPLATQLEQLLWN